MNEVSETSVPPSIGGVKPCRRSALDGGPGIALQHAEHSDRLVGIGRNLTHRFIARFGRGESVEGRGDAQPFRAAPEAVGKRRP